MKNIFNVFSACVFFIVMYAMTMDCDPGKICAGFLCAMYIKQWADSFTSGGVK